MWSIEIDRYRERTELVQDSAYRWSSHRRKGATSTSHIHRLGYIVRLSQFGNRGSFSRLLMMHDVSVLPAVAPPRGRGGERQRPVMCSQAIPTTVKKQGLLYNDIFLMPL
jgi:hypothetical protein